MEGGGGKLTIVQHQIPYLRHQRWWPEAHIVFKRTEQKWRIGTSLTVYRTEALRILCVDDHRRGEGLRQVVERDMAEDLVVCKDRGCSPGRGVGPCSCTISMRK